MPLQPEDLQQSPFPAEAAGGSQLDYLRSQVRRCRRLAASVSDQRTAITLRPMAQEYEQKAQALQRPS